MSVSKTPDNKTSRRILHLDMDAFFAAVEVLDNPSLRGKPVIVGGTPEGHGVVSTASYEARKYGVHSAMPAVQAVKLCPKGIFLRPRGRRYAAVSREVFRILGEYTPLVEPLSIDEAFLDVTGCRPLREPPTPTPEEAMARELKERVRVETGGLTCSVGVAPNKFLAKLASELAKPDGIRVVDPEKIMEFLAPLPVKRIWGVGPRTEEHLCRLGFSRVGDLQEVPPADLERTLGGELGRHLACLSRGIDEREVITDSGAKSISQETTFERFIPPQDRERIEKVLFSLSDHVAHRLRRQGLWARTVNLKVRDERFCTWTRSQGLESPTCLVEEIFGVARSLFHGRIRLEGHCVRLLGVGVSHLTAESWRQLDLFGDGRWKKAARMAEAADAIVEKLGEGSITRGRLIDGPKKEPRGF